MLRFVAQIAIDDLGHALSIRSYVLAVETIAKAVLAAESKTPWVTPEALNLPEWLGDTGPDMLTFEAPALLDPESLALAKRIAQLDTIEASLVEIQSDPASPVLLRARAIEAILRCRRELVSANAEWDFRVAPLTKRIAMGSEDVWGYVTFVSMGRDIAELESALYSRAPSRAASTSWFNALAQAA